MNAFDWDGRLVSYPADRIAAAFGRLGLSRLDPVMFQVTNRAATVLAWYGCLKAGLVPVATLSQHRMHEIGHISRKVGAVGHIVEAGLSFDLVEFAREVADGHPTMRHLFTIGDDISRRAARPDGPSGIDELGLDIPLTEAREFVESVEAQTDSEDVAVFQLSGGTTGVPKVIPRIHAEYWNNGLFYAQSLGWTEESTVAHLIPVIHNAGISCALHATHAVGAALVLANPDAGPAFELMARSGVTDVLIGHGHYQAAQTPAFDAVLPTLRHTVLSGAKVPGELFARVDAGRWAGQMFGMSEGMFLVTPLDAPASARASTVGVPIAASDEIRILDPGSEQPVPAGEVGELCCRGPYTIPGYFDAPDHNVDAFTSDGFYRTGDLAALRDGYVSIEGRIKDLINRGGEKVNAEEVELLLMRHPAIALAAVVAAPDERLGERACAYLVASNGTELTMAQIREHMDSLGVAKFKWPERLVWVPELPRTNVGKVNKKSLRADVVARVEAERAQS